MKTSIKCMSWSDFVLRCFVDQYEMYMLFDKIKCIMKWNEFFHVSVGIVYRN